MIQTITFLDLRPDDSLFQSLDAASHLVLATGRYIGGPQVDAFEREWAEYVGTKYCVSCGNGFDALQLVLRALGADTQEYIRVSEKTCLPTWQAIRTAGSYPAPFSFPSNIIDVRVHLYGIVDPGVATNEVLYLVEDCAHAHGATWHGKKAGSLGIAGCWSFYPTKNLGAFGDAGAVTTDSEFIAERVRELANYGGIGTGINSRMDSLQAAYLRIKLKYLDLWNERRRENASIYMQLLTDCPGVIMTHVPEGCIPCWHQFAVLANDRHFLRIHLKQNGVETMIHYSSPPHRLAATGYDLPYADMWAAHTLSLPIAPHVGEKEIRYVCECIRRFYHA